MVVRAAGAAKFLCVERGFYWAWRAFRFLGQVGVSDLSDRSDLLDTAGTLIGPIYLRGVVDAFGRKSDTSLP